MKGVMPVILLKVLIITLIQVVCVGLWFVFFIILTDTNSHYNEGSFLIVILDWGILAGIIALNTSFANYYCEQKKDVTRFFYGRKMAEYEVQRSVNQEYKKVKPVIIIVHLAAIVAFNFACGMLKSDKGFIQTIIFALPTVVYRIIFRIIGTAGFIISMVKYCKSNFKIEVVVCPHCGKVTRYNVDKTKTFRESWTENKYYIKSDEWGEVYHPGSYEYEYQCIHCGYKFKKVEEE